MRSVTVRGPLVSVSNDPHRVLTQLLSCLLEQASPRDLESKFAPGGDGFSIANVVEARPTSEPGPPYRAPPEGVAAESWTVTMQRAKATPRVVVLDGEELRQLVHAALVPAGTAAGKRNRRDASITFGIGGVTFVVCTLLMHQVADWFVAVPLGLLMGLVASFRVARLFLRGV